MVRILAGSCWVALSNKWHYAQVLTGAIKKPWGFACWSFEQQNAQVWVESKKTQMAQKKRQLYLYYKLH